MPQITKKAKKTGSLVCPLCLCKDKVFELVCVECNAVGLAQVVCIDLLDTFEIPERSKVRPAAKGTAKRVNGQMRMILPTQETLLWHFDRKKWPKTTYKGRIRKVLGKTMR